MTIDKRMKYEMQGGSKPARNYLGSQKTVSGVPVKWKSGPDAPSTELAYITKAEKDLLLKKNLHGSLKNGPNTGPDGIMSLDSQGDYTRDRSPQGRSRQGQAQHDQHMKSILTGQKNIGQTTKTGPKTRKYAVPEYAKVKQKDGTYKNKYIGSGYKSYGQPSFFGNLFSRGAPGYRGIKGMPTFFGKPKFDFKQGPDGMGYYSDYEKFGDTRDALPNFGIMGLIQSLANKFKKPPQDMSEFNKLGLGGTHPAALDFNPDAKIQDTAFSKTPSDKFAYSLGPEALNADRFANTVGPNPEDSGLQTYDPNDIGTWYDTHPATGEAVMTPGFKEKYQSFGRDKLNPRTVYDSYEFKDTGNPFREETWQRPYSYDSSVNQTPKKGIMEHISDWNPLNLIFGTPAYGEEIDFSKLSQASDTFTPEWQSGADKNLAVQAWMKANPNPTKNDFINAIQSGTLGAATPGAFKENVGSLFGGVNLDQSWNPMDATPSLIGTNDATWRQAIDIDKDALEQEAIDALPEGFFKAKGGRVGYANGGLATLFTRRG